MVRAGPDLFSQPEILFFVAAVAISAGCGEFIGSETNPKSLPKRIDSVLGCTPKPETVLREAAKALRRTGLPFNLNTEKRVLMAARALQQRIVDGKYLSSRKAAVFRTPKLRAFLKSRNNLRRVFPQQLFHFLLSEAEVDAWDTGSGRG